MTQAQEDKTYSTVAEVRADVDELMQSPKRDDTELSHSWEDAICEAFVRSVARGTAQDPVGMAKEVERMLAADLPRWYA